MQGYLAHKKLPPLWYLAHKKLPPLWYLAHKKLPPLWQTCALRLVHFRKDIRSHVETGDYFTIGGVLIMEVHSAPYTLQALGPRVPEGPWA